MGRYKIILLLTFIALMPFKAFGAKWEVLKNDKNKTIFLAEAFPEQFNINGEAGMVEGHIDENGNAYFQLRVDELRTGKDLRDDHLQNKHLNKTKYPLIKLSIADMKLAPAFEVNGILTINNEENQVKVKATSKVKDNRMEVMAEFWVDVTKYPSFGKPNYLGIGAKKDVKVQVKFEALKQ